MKQTTFPTIDTIATGQNIINLRKQRGLTVKDLQNWFGFQEPRAIYKWQTGQSLPSIDNLYALSILLDVPMDSIIVGAYSKFVEPQAVACGCHCISEQSIHVVFLNRDLFQGIQDLIKNQLVRIIPIV